MNRKLSIFIVALAVWLTAPTSLQAGSVTFSLNFEFSGATPPAGATPWLTMTFTDTAPNTVTLTVTGNLTADEFVGALYFNLDPSLDVSLINFAAGANPGVAPTISQDADTHQADGDGRYDFLFDFDNGEFTGTESWVWTITTSEANVSLTAESFNFLSVPAGGHGPFLAAAHIQGIGPGGNDSGWIAPTGVPEPSSLFLLGAGLLGLKLSRRIFSIYPR